MKNHHLTNCEVKTFNQTHHHKQPSHLYHSTLICVQLPHHLLHSLQLRRHHKQTKLLYIEHKSCPHCDLSHSKLSNTLITAFHHAPKHQHASQHCMPPNHSTTCPTNQHQLDINMSTNHMHGTHQQHQSPNSCKAPHPKYNTHNYLAPNNHTTNYPTH